MSTCSKRVILVLAAALALGALAAGGCGSGAATTSAAAASPSTTQAADPAEAYKASCEQVDLQALGTNPDAFRGTNVTFEAVIDARGEEEGAFLLVLLTSAAKDTPSAGLISVQYEGSSLDAAAGDSVAIWGEVVGAAELGRPEGAVVVPAIAARYVERK